MPQIPLMELVVSVIGENRQVLTMFKEVEAARERALKGGDQTGLQRELERLGAAAQTANRQLDPLARTSVQLGREMRELGTAIKTGLVPLADGAKRFRELEAAMKAQLGTLAKGSSEYRAIEASMKGAASEATRLEGITKQLNSSFRSDELQRFKTALQDVVVAERSGFTTRQQAIGQLRDQQVALGSLARELGQSASEHKELNNVLDATGAALRKLETDSERLEASFRADYLQRFAGELKMIDASVNNIGFDKAAQEVAELTRGLQSQQSQLALNGREYNDLGKVLVAAAAQQERYQKAAEAASRSTDASQIRAYGEELRQLETELKDTATALGQLDSQQRAIKYDAAGIAAYRRETETLAGGFTEVGRGLESLEAKLRGYAQNLTAGTREHTELNRVLSSTETATKSLAAAQEKASAAYKSADISQFATRLRDVEQAARTGLNTFDESARKVSALQAEMREYGSSLETGARAQRELENVLKQSESAMGRFSVAAEKAQKAFVADEIRRYNVELLELKRSLDTGEATLDEFNVGLEKMQAELREAASQAERGAAAQLAYARALDRADSAHAQANGRVRTFGLSMAVSAGIGDQLSNVLYSLGPAGEAAGVALGAAGAGATKAAGGIKIMQIALAAGLVGALVAVGVGAVALVRNMFAIDTGLTDVGKTTGFTRTELNELAGELQQVALATGTPLDGLLELASVAGSLGITGVQNVASFVDTINKLAVATDIVGAEGAEQLAKFINVTKEVGQTVGESAELVGNVIVRLGNELAATEAPILAMAGRIGGLATTANLSQADILALAGTYVSLGFTAEGAGTSLQSVVNQIFQAGQVGGPALASFAKGAQMTTDEFARLAQTDPAAAFEAYIGGLNDAQKAGTNIVPIIQEITNKNETMLGVITRGVGGFETLGLSMAAARDEAERMTAMNNELNTRLESLRGITSLVGQTFAFAGDSLAVKLIPAMSRGLTSVLDFSRGVLGLEQTGERVETFATRAGRAIGDFGRALVSGGSESDTFAARLGTGFNRAITVVNSAVGLISKALTITVRAAIQNGISVFGTFWTAIQQRSAEGTGAMGRILTALGGIFQNSVQLIGGVLARVPSYFQGVVSAAGILQGAMADVFGGINKIFLGFGFVLYGAVVEPFLDMVAPVTAAAGRVLGVIGNWVKQAGEFFGPFIRAAQRLGGDIADFFGIAADTTRKGINRALTAGLGEYEAGVTQFNDKGTQLVRGQALVAEGFNQASVGVQTAVGGLKTALDEQNVALEASVDDAEGLGAANEALAGTADEAAAGTERLTQAQRDAIITEHALGTATEELAVAQVNYASLTKLGVEDTQRYLERLEAVKAAYPGLRGELNPLIEATRDHLRTLQEEAPALAEVTTETDAAAEAASKLAERQATVGEAIELLGRGAGATSDELFAMAMTLSDAARGNDETAAAARGLQTELVLSAAAMDAQAAATEAAIAAGEDFQAKLDTVAEAQDLLGKGTSATSDELFAMVGNLNDAASGTGGFAEHARRLQQEMIALAVSIDEEAAALEAAIAAGEEFQTKLDTVADAQDLLSQGTGASSDALFQMAISLADAASGTGAFADHARALQTELALQAAAMDEAAASAEALAEAEDVIVRGTDALHKGLSLSSDELFSLAQELSVVAAGETEVADEAAALAQELINNAVAVDEQARAMEEAAAAAERYQENMTTVNEASGLLAQGAGASSDSLFEMAMSLSEAAEGTGVLGERARRLQTELVLLAASNDQAAAAEERQKAALEGLEGVMDELGTSAGKSVGDFAVMRAAIEEAGAAGAITAERMRELLLEVDALEQRAREGAALQGYGALLGQLGELLATGAAGAADSKTGFAAVISGLGAAAVEAGGLMDEFAGDLDSQLGAAGAVFGAFADVVRQVFGEELPSQVEIGLSALETGIQGAAAGFSIGGPIGAAIGGGLGLIMGFFTASSQAAEAAAAEEKARQEEAAEAHAEYIEGWKERERERVESIREGQRELDRIYGEMRESQASLNRDLNEARLDNARASGAEESVIFISETILAIRQASADFHTEMQRITQEKNEFIKAYLQANPGATRGEAAARAEQIFGPERDAYREQYVLTTETLLLESEEQAKKLGLSQREFYEAVFAGNTELLGNMTEGQRLAIVEFVGIAREMGLELPKVITDAADATNEAQRGAGESNAEAQREATKLRIEALREEKDEYKAAWEERSATLKELIANSTGETRAAYIGMFVEESAAYEQGLRERNEVINRANEEGSQATTESLTKARDKERAAWEDRSQWLQEQISKSTGALKQYYERLYDEEKTAYETSQQEFEDAITEGNDGIGSALESNARATVEMIQRDISTLNTAWADRAAFLQERIASTSGVTREAYERAYREESAAYESNMRLLQQDLVNANQALLDAQDQSADDFVAAQEEIGRREQEALSSVFATLRELLGEDAQLIIDMIQRTYNGRREAYLANGTATAEAAERANQSELDALDGIFAQLRELLGPDAQIIIDLIQRTYDARTNAYNSGGTAAANAAQQSAEAERTSVANINQVLRDLFGPEAEGIINQILALYSKRERAYREGGAGAAAGAEAGATSERTSIANINQMLRDIFGPEAEGIINQILALYNKREGVYREGGKATSDAAAEGSDAEAGAVNEGTNKIGGALSEREKTLQGFLERTDLSPEVRRLSEELRSAFVEGDGLTAAQVAEGRERVATALEERDRRITELVGQGKTQAEAARIADRELADTLRGLGEDIGVGAREGGDLAVQGIGEADRSQTEAISTLLDNLKGSVGGIPDSALPIINNAFANLTGGFDSGTNLFAQGVDSGWGRLNTTFGSLGGTFDTTVSSVFGRISGSLTTGYRLTAQAQASGSSEQLAQIKRAYDAEKAEFNSKSAEYERAIGEAKGAERQRLIDEYEQLQREHAAKSADYQRAIGDAAGDEKGSIGDAATLVTRALGVLGSDSAEASKNAYDAMRKKHDEMSKLFRALMGSAAQDERQAAILAGAATAGGLGDMATKVTSATITAFGKQTSTFKTQVGGFVGAINSQETLLKRALDAIASVIKNFKYPPMPKPPTVPVGTINAINSLSSDAGPKFEGVTSVPLLSSASAFGTVGASMGLFAGDVALPDFSSATNDARLFAAETISIFDFLQNSARNISLSATQERALTLNLNFSGLRDVLSGPAETLDRAANLMWESVKYQRETALIERETALFNARSGGAPRSAFDDALRPPRRKVDR